MQGVCGRGGDGPTSPGLLGGLPHLLHSGFFCQAGKEGKICLLLILLLPGDLHLPQQPQCSVRPSLCTRAAPNLRTQQEESPVCRLSLWGLGWVSTGISPGWGQHPGLAPSSTESPPGVMLGQQLVPRHLRVPSGAELQAPSCHGHHRGQCSLAPIALGCGGSQHPTEPCKGMKTKPNCPSPILRVTTVTHPSHLRTIHPTWRFSLLQLGNSVRPPRSLPGASPFPGADKTFSRSPHALPGRVSAKGLGKDERDFPADLLTPYYLHLLSRTQTDIFPMLRGSAPSLHSRPEQCQECTWE